MDLTSDGDISLVSNNGAVRMDAGTQIHSGGAVALTAATGVTVGQITADQRIDLYSAGGTVQAAEALPGQAHLQATAVSFYGYGLALPLAPEAPVLVVDAQALQVGAPSGIASRGYAADGSIYYRLRDSGMAYHQLEVFDQAPERVMTPRSEVQTWAAQLAESQPLAVVWDNNMGLSAWLQSAVNTAMDSSATAQYLRAVAPASVGMQSFGTLFDAQDGDEMDSMEYGLSESSNLGVSLLDASNDLLRSTGQLLSTSSWSIEAQGW